MIKEKIKLFFPNFSDQNLVAAIEKVAAIVQVKKGDFLMDVGSYIKFMPLVTRGLIKVMREDNDGNEVLLYYLDSGKTCAMSVSCCLKLEKSTIRAIAEEDSEVILIPVQYVDQWISQFSEWKNFVLNSYAQRFEDLLEALDIFAFKKMDERLLNYLKKRFSALGDKTHPITHQEIAMELNTSREVVSRLLKKLEQAKQITISKNLITVL